MSLSVISELDQPEFRLAVAQFDQAAEAMNLDPNLRATIEISPTVPHGQPSRSYGRWKCEGLYGVPCTT